MFVQPWHLSALVDCAYLTSSLSNNFWNKLNLGYHDMNDPIWLTTMENTPKIETDTENLKEESYVKHKDLTSGPHPDDEGFHQLEGGERDTLQYRLYDSWYVRVESLYAQP